MFRKIISRTDKKFSVIECCDFHSSTPPGITLRNYINELEKNKVDIAIVKITAKYISKGTYEGIKFNILVYDNVEKYYDKLLQKEWLVYQKKIFSKMERDDIAIINIDDETVLELLQGSKMCVITYGLSSKVTITVSSIIQDSNSSTIIYCLQRTISTIGKKSIDPQEFSIKLSSLSDKDIYTTLAAVTTALVCDVDIKLTQALSL
jgi:UDP-N-acetylmuramyl tripeptide synthase